MISTVTLYDEEDKILDHQSYSNHKEMRQIIYKWKKDFPNSLYYQVNPKLTNVIKIEPITKRGRILLTSLKIA